MPHEKPITGSTNASAAEYTEQPGMAQINPQGAPLSQLRDNMSPRSRGLAMLQQKRFEEDADEESKNVGN